MHLRACDEKVVPSLIHYKNNSYNLFKTLELKDISQIFEEIVKLWITMYEFHRFPQKLKNERSCSSLKDSSNSYLSPCFFLRELIDLSLIFLVIHRNVRVLLLRLYFYKTTKEQLKASSFSTAKQGAVRTLRRPSIPLQTRDVWQKKALSKLKRATLKIWRKMRSLDRSTWG